MKKILIFLLAALWALSCAAIAEDSYETSVSLCCSDLVYAVDYVFSVPDGADISSVTVSDAACMYDWNYDKTEARLYLSLASAEPIAKAKTIASVASDRPVALSLVSLKVNGKTQENAFAEHVPTDIDAVAPGYDTPGATSGKRCANCGVVLTEPSPVLPTGPIISAVLDADGNLTVSGGLSDNPAAEGTTFLAVYGEENRMLTVADITDRDQSEFLIRIEAMQDARAVKVLRWAMPNLTPLHSAVEVPVTSA